ncbi:MAG: U32 family peptidase [Prevotella sp.]|nr:U32 family peptidase [Prevotella sp.]
MRRLELLAPAKNLQCGKAAIDHGADAVYMGAMRYGARAAAGNSVEDIGELCRYAHQFGAKVYVTVNTIIYDDEMADTLSLIDELQKVDVDALLVQDMGLVAQIRDREIKDKIVLHASTQTDNRTIEKVRWLQGLGFRRVVLARELSMEEIREIHAAVPDVELEVFVHGALCVSYSGVCYASQYCLGRSANRGECAQMCRMKYDLLDADGHEIEHDRHLLSLKDLCQIDHLEELADAGATSFKIEGRLKDVDYVKNVVSAYSKRLDALCRHRPGEYARASKGRVTYYFEPNLNKTFNRGYTTYFLNGRQTDIASFDTPKAMGEYVGHVKTIKSHPTAIVVSSTSAFSNGDGLCFFKEGELVGFRVNRVEGNHLFPLKMPEGLRPGMALYRNKDEAFAKLMAGKTAERRLPVTMRFSETADGFELTIAESGRGKKVSCQLPTEKVLAEKPQRENIERQLTKLGNTVLCLEDFEIEGNADQYFIPSSALSDLRRKTVEAFCEGGNKDEPTVAVRERLRVGERSSGIARESNGRRMKDESIGMKDAPLPTPRSYQRFGYMYNVANKAARDFYEALGLSDVEEAFELGVSKGRQEPLMLMQCRHCIRFSLGYCVRRGGRQPRWHEPLYLRLGDGRRFRLEFDCAECQMKVMTI